jgi:lauroyl/myristoyl acyltransferase
MSLVVQLQKFGIALTRVLPENILDWLATHIGLVCWAVLKQKRRYIEANVRHIFHDQPLSIEKQRQLVKRTFVSFARAMIDFFRLGSITLEEFKVHCIGIENIKAALEHGQGCIGISAHIGNWDYAGAYLAANGIPTSALVEVTEPETFELYSRHREHTGMRTYPLARAGLAFLQTIRNNRLLAVLADRDIMDNGIVVDFFDAKRKIPRGLGEIIVRKQIPVVFAYMVLISNPVKARYLFVVEEPVTFTDSVKAFHIWLVKKFEGLLRAYPEQWFVFHPEWIE